MGQPMPWHLNQLVAPVYTRVDLVKEGANSEAHIKLMKSRGGSIMDLTEILAKMKPEHSAIIQKALDDKDAERLAAVEKAKKDAADAADAASAAADGDADDEAVVKSIKDPAVRKMMETSIAKQKAAEAVVKQLKDEQDTKDAIAKAKEVPNLGAEEAALADIYKKLKNVDSGLCDNVFGIMKAASALVAEGGVFTEIGKGSKDGGAIGDEKSAWDKIDKAAEEIVKSKDITKAQAIAQVMKDKPQLYADYLTAQRA